MLSYLVSTTMDAYAIPRVINIEANSCAARAPEKQMLGNISASLSANQEPIPNKRLDNEDFYKETTIYHLSSKILPLSIDGTVRSSSSDLENRNPVTMPKQHISSPNGDSTIHNKFQGSPVRKPASQELLSIERMDRLLKMRRRRSDHRIRYYQSHAWSSDEKSSKSLLHKGVSNAHHAKENKFPQDLFLPIVDDDIVSNAGPPCPSKFHLKPRLKRKSVLSQRKREYGFFR